LITKPYIMRCLLVALMTLGLWVSIPALPESGNAFAQAASQGSPAKGEPKTTDGKGGIVKCRTYQEAAGGTLLGVLVPCITKTMETTTAEFSAKLIGLLNPLLYSFITLVIVLFGIKVLMGNVARLKAEAFFLILKISLVVGMLPLIPTFWVPATFDMMTESQAIVAGAIDTTGIACEIEKYGDSNTPMIWKQMDCVLGKLYGFATGNGNQPNMLLASSAFGMLGGFFFGGTFGVTLFLACVGVLWGMFQIVIRAAITFVNGYLYVCVMFILSPIFLPLVLLRSTEGNYEKWWRGILGAALLPIIISSYVMFALMLYDKVLFQPDSLFQKLFDPKFTAQIQKLPKKPCGFETLSDPNYRSKSTGQQEKNIYSSPLLSNLISPTRGGSNDPCSAISLPTIDVSHLSADYPNQKEVFKKMFNDIIKVLVTTWLISAGFKYIVTASQKIVGSISASQITQASSHDEQKLATSLEGAKQGLYKSYGDATGAEFIKRTTTVPENVIKGFVGKLGNDN